MWARLRAVIDTGGPRRPLPSRAERVDDDLGVREEVEFFGAPERLFGCRHLPLRGPVEGAPLAVVICSPVLTDFGANYQREVRLARRMAAAGIPVQRFHPRGTGHSDGERTDLAFRALVDDARAALAQLRAACRPAAVALLGSRLAALAAATVAGEEPGAPLVLWDPVPSLRAYLRAGLRARAVHRVGKDGDGPEDPDAQLDRLGYVDVLGIPVGPGLYRAGDVPELGDALGGGPRRVLLVQFAPGALTPPCAAAADAWRSRGVDVTAEVCPCDESWWFIPDRRAAADAVLDTTAAWMAARAAGAAA
jgi:Serine aminopeptidase, S33